MVTPNEILIKSKYVSSIFGERIYSKALEQDLLDILELKHMNPTAWGKFCWIMYYAGFSIEEGVKLFREKSKCNYRGDEETRRQLEYYYEGTKNGTHTKKVKSTGKTKDNGKKEYTRERLIKLFYVNFKPLQIDFRIPDNDVFNGAIAYFEHGFNVIPVTNKKKPFFKWREGLIDYATWPLNPRHIDRGYWSESVAVAGTDKHVFLDIDKKSDEHPEGIEQNEIDRIRTLFKGYHMETSVNGGLHIWAYGNLSKIDSRAYIDATEGGLTIKGKGSYILAAPSLGYYLLQG